MAEHDDHGHTPAAWTGVIISMIGFCVGGGFMIAAQPAGFWGGMGLILAGPLVGGVMKAMGLGKHDEPPVRTAPARVEREDREDTDEAPVHASA